MTTEQDSYAWPPAGEQLHTFDTAGRHALRSEPVHRAIAELADPVHVFTKLVRELQAASVLVSLGTSAGEVRAACLEGLALARDVLADVAQLLEDGTESEAGR